MHIIFLHSTGGDPQESFFPWAKAELEKLGHQVSCPAFPNSIEPNPLVAVPLVMDVYDPSQETVFIGRSSGGTLIPHVLMQESVKAELCISLAAPFENIGWDNLNKLFAHQPDYEKARSSVDQYLHWYSDDDPYVPLDHADQFQEVLGGDIRVFKAYSHFYNEEFSELIEEIQKLEQKAWSDSHELIIFAGLIGKQALVDSSTDSSRLHTEW